MKVSRPLIYQLVTVSSITENHGIVYISMILTFKLSCSYSLNEMTVMSGDGPP